MNNSFKPEGYNSLSPYLIVDDAKRLVQLLRAVFHAEEQRSFIDEQGRIVHLELRIDDSVLMISNSTPDYPANKLMLHLYVPEVLRTFELAEKNGCEVIERPIQQEGDPDMRGSFYDCAGNYWAVSTQME